MNVMKHIDGIANIAIIVAVVTFLGLVVRGNFGTHPFPNASTRDLVGKPFNLPGIQFPRDRNTIVLAISSNCHFCKDSLPFYKQLTERSRGRLNIIAVMPETTSDGQKFLQDAGIVTNQTVSVGLDSIGVLGTPTVLLVDASGNVKRVWAGWLDEKGQSNLLALALSNK